MTPLAVFIRTLLKTSAVFMGATAVILHPNLDFSAPVHGVTAKQSPAEGAIDALVYSTLEARGLRALVADLSAVDASVRAKAACELRDLGDLAADAIQPIAGLLGDAAPVESSICGRRWWRRGGDNDFTSPGEQAAAALVAVGTRAFQPVLAALRATSWNARRNAAWALGALDDHRAVAGLVEALTDREPGVREQAAWALGAIDDSDAVPPLVAALKDGDPRVRRQAAWALGAIDDRRAVDGLSAALTDTDDKTRAQAAWALGAINAREGAPGLIRALGDPASNVRQQAAWALGAIGDSRAVDALIRALGDQHSGVRQQAAWGLGAIGDSRALQGLLPSLKDPDAGVRKQAAWAIGSSEGEARDPRSACCWPRRSPATFPHAWRCGIDPLHALRSD